MRATLIHNPGAGEGRASRASLLRLLRGAGYDPTYLSTKDKNYDEAVAGAEGLVVAAGGDGTVRRVAIALAGSKAVMAVLPMGTANNLARALGLTGSHARMAETWKDARPRRFDIGRVAMPWEESHVVESVGLGWFSDTMARLDKRAAAELEAVAARDQRLSRARLHFIKAIRRARPFDAVITVDRRRFAGRFLAVEAMNICSLGPNLMLAPAADSADGKLDVVLVRADERAHLDDYLRRRIDHEPDPPALTVVRGRRVRIEAEARRPHIDDKPGPRKSVRLGGRVDGEAMTIDIGLRRGAVAILAPE
ncbi:MAG: hypothetical protein IT562_15495 [Alphaproteobacteria bacterium]|nr:hypothetical protein [Alphaproteobacteria bacterium]